METGKIIESKNTKETGSLSQNQSRTKVLVTLLYLKYFRKLVFLFYICLNVVYHGLQVEFYRVNNNWKTLQIIELFLLFLIAIDIIIVEVKFLKFKGKLMTCLMSAFFAISLVQISLKIWGPEGTGRDSRIAVNIIRIFITLYLLFALDEKELFDFYPNAKRKQKSIVKDNVEMIEERNQGTPTPIINIITTIDKNMNPNGLINNKLMNNLKKPMSQRGSLLKVDKKGSDELSELKIVEELIAAVKQTAQQKEENEIRLNLNGIKPFTKTLVDGLESLLLDNFDIFEFDSNCLRNSSFLIMNYFFQFYKWDNIDSNIKINETKFMNLVYNIQKNYNDNPYHNALHAADVTNTLFYMLEKLEVKKTCAYTNLEIMILLLSSATHDIDHPGNTNLFESNSRSLLALTYNDRSILENYHLFLFFNFLQNEDMNIFSHLDMTEVRSIRKQFITNIIATDMLNHKSDLKKIQDLISAKDFDREKKENREFISGQLLHFSDISNGTKPFSIYQKWVDKLFLEFFAQGDKEKEMSLPVSMLCDREKTLIPEAQVFFINVITMDLAKTFTNVFPKFKHFVDNLEINRSLWEERKGKPYEISEDED